MQLGHTRKKKDIQVQGKREVLSAGQRKAGQMSEGLVIGARKNQSVIHTKTRGVARDATRTGNGRDLYHPSIVRDWVQPIALSRGWWTAENGSMSFFVHGWLECVHAV